MSVFNFLTKTYNFFFLDITVELLMIILYLPLLTLNPSSNCISLASSPADFNTNFLIGFIFKVTALYMLIGLHAYVSQTYVADSQ